MENDLPTYRRTPSEDLSNRVGRPLFRWLYPFYRSYPYSGRTSLYQVEHRGAYSPDDGFFYNRVPKAANTSVSHMLASHSTYSRPRPGAGTMGRMLRPQLMTTAQVADIGTDAVFKFTVVRNPYTRVLSAYRSKILTARKPVRLHRFAAMMGTDRAAPPDFTTFCRFLANGGVWRDAHWAPQTELMLLPLRMFDFIGHVESLDEDVVTIARRIWGPDVAVDFKRQGRRTDVTQPVEQDYTPEAIEIVARLYADDFSAFGYSTDFEHRRAAPAGWVAPSEQTPPR